MEWKNVSSEETMSALNAPEMRDETVYASLYEELEKKCNPVNFMVPYDECKVALANDIYADVLKSLDAGEEVWRILRRKAIQKLGICFSTAHLYEPLYRQCHPKNFMHPYHPDKLRIANELYARIIQQAYDIEALEAIRQLAEDQLGVKVRERRWSANAEEQDDGSIVGGVIMWVIMWVVVWVVVVMLVVFVTDNMR